MFGKFVLKRGHKDEGEKPFWISYSDLMTALMTIFLVVMCVSLLSVTRKQNQVEQRKIQREKEITEIMKMLEVHSIQFPQVKIDAVTYRINLGEKVLFQRESADISIEGQKFLRGYVPTLLNVYSTDIGKRWIKRIVVEGFTDQDGTYLYNLNLSLARSQSVVCSLFDVCSSDERPLTRDELNEIRDLFLVGGYSFNSIKSSKEASRRVEFCLEFWPVDEVPLKNQPVITNDFGRCQLR